MMFAKVSKVARSGSKGIAFEGTALLDSPEVIALPMPREVLSARVVGTGSPSELVTVEPQGRALALVSFGLSAGSEDLVIKVACGASPGRQLATVFASVVITPFDAGILETLDAINGGPDYHWRLADASATTMAARVGSVAGAWVNGGDLRFGVDPITTNAEGGKSVGFGAASSNAGHGTIEVGGSGITLAAVRAISMFLQVDKVATKYLILTTESADLAPGDMGCELISDGAGGMIPRMYVRDPAGVPYIVRGASPGSIPIGQAFHMLWIQGADYLEVRVNGETVLLEGESGAATTWSAVPAGTLWVGIWRTGVAPYDGLMSELAIYNGYVPSLGEGLSLAMAQNVSWLADFDAGTIPVPGFKAIDLSPYAHPNAGAVASVVTAPSLGTVDAAALEIDYTTDDETGTADPFTARITANGIVSRTATIDLDTPSSGGSEELNDTPNYGQWIGQTAFGGGAGNAPTIEGQAFWTSMSWAPPRNGTINKIRIDINFHRADYTEGTGGDMRIEVREDDGNGFPDFSSGALIHRSQLWIGMKNPPSPIETPHAGKIDIPIPNWEFTRGQHVHWVYTNENASPNVNYFSTNCCNDWNIEPDLVPPHQDVLLFDKHYIVEYFKNGSPRIRGRMNPMFVQWWTDGIITGQPFTDAGPAYPVSTIAGGTSLTGATREIGGPWEIRQFWLHSDPTMTMNRLRARVHRRNNSTASPLRARIQRLEAGGSETTIADVNIAASGVPYVPSNHYGQTGPKWATTDVSLGGSVTIEQGRTYRLRLSSGPSVGTIYALQAANVGPDVLNVGWERWRGGHAQYSENSGSSWLNMHGYGARVTTRHWNMALWYQA